MTAAYQHKPHTGANPGTTEVFSQVEVCPETSPVQTLNWMRNKLLGRKLCRPTTVAGQNFPKRQLYAARNSPGNDLSGHWFGWTEFFTQTSTLVGQQFLVGQHFLQTHNLILTELFSSTSLVGAEILPTFLRDTTTKPFC